MGADIEWTADSEAKAEVQRADCEVIDEDSVRCCVEDIEKSHGPIDILVNDAAIVSLITPKPFEAISIDEWKEMLVVNTIAPFLCCKAVVSRMRERGWAGSST